MDYFKVGKLKNAESNLNSEVNFTPLLVTPYMHTNRNPMDPNGLIAHNAAGIQGVKNTLGICPMELQMDVAQNP